MERTTLRWIEKELSQLEEQMVRCAKEWLHIQTELDSKQIPAAQNFIHYLSLRSQDIRRLQHALHKHGLSSLSNSESHVLAHIQLVLERIGKKYLPNSKSPYPIDWAEKSIQQKRTLLFGKKLKPALPHIMVTFDKKFGTDIAHIKMLLENGMNVARINCAHDSKEVWLKMIQSILKAQKETGMKCKIHMDLAGPKIRVKLLNKGKDDGKVKIRVGDVIWLSDSPEGFEKNEVVISPNEAGIIASLQIKERVYFDDGIIKGLVIKIEPNKVGVKIIRDSSEKGIIKQGKGINFPDSTLNIPSLTQYDISCLPFICRHADLIGYSFVRNKKDIEYLFAQLETINRKHPHLILKIETPSAVAELPSLLLASMKKPVFGVMIARGDLAVEVGFERMGELQNEILWICESAHVPVIWATQVLETLNKTGIATRSEITDAMQASGSECVMLNKGKYTIKTLETLSNIFERSQGHHNKKRATFRKLNIASQFMNQV
ncbi:MAG: pyruvate kinase [Hydrotalea sp.]|nr:pyruvate kinase [Hydrotalea sp.]